MSPSNTKHELWNPGKEKRIYTVRLYLDIVMVKVITHGPAKTYQMTKSQARNDYKEFREQIKQDELKQQEAS